MTRRFAASMLLLLIGASSAGWVLKQTSELRSTAEYETQRAADCRSIASSILEARGAATNADVDYIRREPLVFISLVHRAAKSGAIPSTSISVDRDAPHSAPKITPFVRDVGTRVTLRDVSVKQTAHFFDQISTAIPHLHLRELTLRQVPPRSGKWEATGVLSYFLWEPDRETRGTASDEGKRTKGTDDRD